jgi:hypothetical protein
MAVLLEQFNETQCALEFNKKSLDIRRRMLPHNYPLVAITLNNIGMVHLARYEFDDALIFLEQT